MATAGAGLTRTVITAALIIARTHGASADGCVNTDVMMVLLAISTIQITTMAADLAILVAEDIDGIETKNEMSVATIRFA